ncbi:MAG: hypothetical protein HY042_10945, partial [Spirochaetia bacterium]|nr:hypothetical protein [Spirochaetia bacterium]
VADDLEVSFLIARTYYNEARQYWDEAKKYAEEADQHKFELDLPAIETERYQIRTGKLNFDRIISLHVDRVESKLALTKEFLDEEGRPRPVKVKMLEDIEKMYDEKFPVDPLEKPQLNPHWNQKDLFPD